MPKVERMIEDEVEKRIKEILFKNESEAVVKRKLFQEDDQDSQEKKAKVLYEEQLEKLRQANNKMNRSKE